MTQPRYSKRHYEDVAAILKDRHRVARDIRVGGRPSGTHLITGAVAGFTVLFENDNPRFDRQRFLTACAEPFPELVQQ